MDPKILPEKVYLPHPSFPKFRYATAGSRGFQLDDGKKLTGKPDQFDGKNPWVSGEDFPNKSNPVIISLRRPRLRGSWNIGEMESSISSGLASELEIPPSFHGGFLTIGISLVGGFKHFLICFMFHNKKGMSSFPLTNSYFSRWLKSPTSIGIQLINDG